MRQLQTSNIFLIKRLIVKFYCFIVISYAHFQSFANLTLIKTAKKTALKVVIWNQVIGLLESRIHIIAPLYAVSGVCGQAFVFY